MKTTNRNDKNNGGGATKPDPTKKDHKTVKPDEGQGSKGNFGDDGDWGKQNEDLKRKQREASPIPIKEAK